MPPAVLVVRAPGTNCDLETAYAFELAGATAERVHVRRWLEQPRLAERFQIVCFPGGFSYGDDLAAGRILGNQIRHHLRDALGDFKAAGKLILGICNGFQILLKSGVLLDDEPDGVPPATLALNASGRYEDRWVRLTSGGSNSVFLAGIETTYLPVAHAEGRFVPRSEASLARLQQQRQVALRYVSQHGATERPSYPDNPNGAIDDIAAVCDSTGRALGLMPHPERHIDRTHHPRWTRGEGADPGDGLALFKNAVRYFR